MMPDKCATPLSAEEVAIYQAMSKSAIVYMLMRRLEHPLNAREVAELLCIHEQTASRYLRSLARLNLVAHSGFDNSYVLLAGRQIALTPGDQISRQRPEDVIIERHPGSKSSCISDQADTQEFIPAASTSDGAPASMPGSSQDPERSLPEDMHSSEQSDNSISQTVKKTRHPDDNQSQNVKKARHPDDTEAQTVKITQSPEDIQPPSMKKTRSPSININNNPDNKSNNPVNDSEETVLIRDDPAKNSQLGDDDEQRAVWQELFAAGINNNARTRRLVRQPHIIATYVRGHRLKLAASGKSGEKWAGSLVTILESGQPAPDLNPNGHLASCNCVECHGYKIARSWEDTW